MTPSVTRINGPVISVETTHRFLGVIIGRDASWTPYISYVKKSFIAIAYVFKFVMKQSRGYLCNRCYSYTMHSL